MKCVHGKENKRRAETAAKDLFNYAFFSRFKYVAIFESSNGENEIIKISLSKKKNSMNFTCLSASSPKQAGKSIGVQIDGN